MINKTHCLAFNKKLLDGQREQKLWTILRQKNQQIEGHQSQR